tara:strand:- start:4267 stop:6132 length:1866 start_codon:yes stop_codon:yes gene_type:complete
MPASFPSKAVVVMDIPEVTRLDVTFVYNFFRPDERLNDSGTEYDLSGWQSTGGSNTAASTARKLLHLGVARYAKITFSPVILSPTYTNKNEFVTPINAPAQPGKLIAPNLGIIRNEIEVATMGSSAVVFHDHALQERLAKLINLSLSLRDPEAAKQGSSAEKAKKLNDLTPNSVVGNVLFDTVFDPAAEGMFYVNHKTGRVLRHTGRRDFGGQAAQRLYCQVSDRYIGAMFKNSASNPFGPFAASISKEVSQMVDIGSNAKLNENPSVLSGEEYSVNLQPLEEIEMVPLDEPRMWSNATLIGYVIDKDEVLPDGSREKQDPIIVPSSTTHSVVDTKVKYGAIYSYSVRAILLYEYEAIVTGEDRLTIASSLLSSRPSTPAVLACEEFTPPPHPADFNLVWDYRNRKLRLFWSMPIVATRDVKRFQVLRRKSVSEPFELIREYDFDDSDVLTPRKEVPDLSRVIKTEHSVGVFVDEEFTKDSTFIYALCSIDAHDLTSNYSQQFVVSFDRYKNKLVKQLISPSGAPKAYPNFYLLPDIGVGIGNTNITVDAMKDSSHKQMKIYFDPEYLTVKEASGLWSSRGKALRLIDTTSSDSLYKLQIINVDRQKSQVLDIKIEDLRTL